MSEVNYKKAGTWYLVGNIFNKGIAFLTVPVFTRILVPADYGVVTTYNSWIAILAMIVGFALHMAIRAAFIDHEAEIEDFMSSMILFTWLWSIPLTAVVCLISYLLPLNISTSLILLCMFQGIATALVQDYTHYLMMRYRYKFRTLLMVLPNLISVLVSIVCILFVFKTEKYLGRIIPTALIHLAFGVLVTVLVLRRGKWKINFQYIKYALGISAPLILHGIALQILSQSDRTMITALADSAQTGIYGLIYNFSMIATVITTALEGVFVPWFTRKMKEAAYGEINRISKDYLHLMTYAMVALILVAPEVVKLMADKAYWEGIVIIPPVVLANFVIFGYTLFVNVEHYHKSTLFISINTLIAAAVNIGLNLLFIPKFGYVAAAYTTVASYVVSFTLHAIRSKHIVRDLYPFRMFLRPFAHVVAVSVLFYLTMDLWWVRWLVMVTYVGAMFFRERKRIVEFFPKLQK